MPIVRYSNELVRLNQANVFQQQVTAPTVSATTLSSNTISISGLPSLGSQGAPRPEEFTDISQIVDYIERIKQALINMGVMQ